MEEIDFLDRGCFLPRALPWRPAALRPPDKNDMYRVWLFMKISLWSFHSSKGIQLFKSGQTHRLTDTKRCTLPYIVGEVKLFMALLIPFTSVHWWRIKNFELLCYLETNIIYNFPLVVTGLAELPKWFNLEGSVNDCLFCPYVSNKSKPGYS
jgi:hypothetical protein